jgi:hypothetical protein
MQQLYQILYTSSISELDEYQEKEFETMQKKEKKKGNILTKDFDQHLCNYTSFLESASHT